MFDPITLALVGGAVGGLLNKKDPIKGALLGAGAGFTGGSLAAGGLLGGAGAAGGAAGGTGLTAATGTGLSLGTGSGGIGLTAGAGQGATLASTSSGLGLNAGNAALGSEAGGLLGGMKTAMSYAKPVGEAAMAANAVNGLVNPPQAPIQSGLPQRQQADFGGLLGNGQVAQLQQKRLARRGMVG